MVVWLKRGCYRQFDWDVLNANYRCVCEFVREGRGVTEGKMVLAGFRESQGYNDQESLPSASNINLERPMSFPSMIHGAAAFVQLHGLKKKTRTDKKNQNPYNPDI